ncbi:hypothetical protein ACNKHL_01465 [Shigella flexneri]
MPLSSGQLMGTGLLAVVGIKLPGLELKTSE